MPILPARIVRLAVVAGLFLSGVAPAPAVAQTYRHAGTEFEAVRRVVLPEDKSPAIAVTEFHHHGQIDRHGMNVLAVSADRRPLATRVLQLGPGDFCRVAFETDPRQREYFVFYGGKPPKPDDVPKWTRTEGLLLETRYYRQCNLNSFESVKQAFESSERIGSNYVDAVQHSGNPFLLGNAPFLSRYSGTFELAAQGRYGFFTSSEDCSFLLIDGELVVAAPGRHGPERRALPGNRKEVQLSAGQHTFEYYHAASGPSATMVAAWETNPGRDKPAPGPMPPAVFRADAIAHLPAQPAETRQEKLVPNFAYTIRGSVPLPDNPQHLVGVQLQNVSSPALLTKSKILWEFGDGQTSELPNPQHVYLRPGLYSVRLSIQRGVKRVDMTHQLQIDEPDLERPKEVDDLDKYLPIVEAYAPERLDAASLRQLVLAFLWKAELIAEPRAGDEPPAGVQPAAETAEARAARTTQSRGYVARAVDAGKVALLSESAATGDEELFKLAQIVGPAARDQLGNSLLAGQIWSAASRKIARPEYRAECQLQAADIAAERPSQSARGQAAAGVGHRSSRPGTDRRVDLARQAGLGRLPCGHRRRRPSPPGLHGSGTGAGLVADPRRTDCVAGRLLPFDGAIPDPGRLSSGGRTASRLAGGVSHGEDPRLPAPAVCPLLGGKKEPRRGRCAKRPAPGRQPGFGLRRSAPLAGG